MASDSPDSANSRGGAASETTPLLAPGLLASEQDPNVAESLLSSSATAASAAPGDKPLPKTQIILLCYARLVEPIAFFSIFPYINQMLQYNGDLPATDVGFYSGFIESLFSLTQMLVMMFWGRVADRVGRKPVLVVSLVGVALSTSIFGLARNLWQMIVFRCLAGVFAGTILTVRTMISEHSTARTQARSFSWFAFAGNIGIFLGPLIGGALAVPASLYPGIFGDMPFFREYPYALPSFAVGLVGLTAVVTTALFVEETLKRRPGKARDCDEDGTAALGTASDEPEPMSTWELLQAPGVAKALYVYGHVTVLAFAYTAVLPVFLFTPVEFGGCGMSAMQISLVMTLTGLAQATWLLVIFPPLQHRFGTNGVLRGCGIAYPCFLALCPVFSELLRSGGEGAATIFWTVGPFFLVIGVGISMSFTAIQLAVNDVSPSPETLGTLNALALTGTSALRSFTPVLFAVIYAGKFQFSDVAIPSFPPPHFCSSSLHPEPWH
jgi:MFS family permease